MLRSPPCTAHHLQHVASEVLQTQCLRNNHKITARSSFANNMCLIQNTCVTMSRLHIMFDAMVLVSTTGKQWVITFGQWCTSLSSSCCLWSWEARLWGMKSWWGVLKKTSCGERDRGLDEALAVDSEPYAGWGFTGQLAPACGFGGQEVIRAAERDEEGFAPLPTAALNNFYIFSNTESGFSSS